ncbi:14906_t:CDS:2, partial [Racocetra fulgida]
VQLLCGLFSEATIVDYDVKNYVYKFRRTHDIQRCDTARLFQHFEKEHTKNPDWYVQALIDPETNRLQGVQPGTFMIDADPGLEKEQFAGRFAAWHKKTTSYMTPSVSGRLFPEIYNILQNKKVNFEDSYNLTLEIVDNGLIKFEYDFCQIYFDELLEGIDHSLVAEVWEVQSIEHKSNIGQNSEKAYFHISLIPRRWYKDEFMDAVVVDEPFLRRNSLKKNTATKAIGRKQSIKETLLGLARKCVEVVNYDDLNNSKILIETFKEWIRIHEEAQCSKQIIEHELDDNQIVESDQGTENNQDTESDQDTENDQDIETTRLDVQNPLKYIGKGRPSKRHIKSAIEKLKKQLMMIYE